MLKGKIISIFPFIFVACIISVVINSIGNFSFDLTAKNLLFSLSDMLGLQMYGLPGFWATGVSWYISSLFIISFLIFPLLCKHRDLFTKFLAPVSALLVYGCLLIKTGSVNDPGAWIDFVYKGLLRGYAGIALGCVAFEVCEWLRASDIGRTKASKGVLSVIELTGYITAVWFGFSYKNNDGTDFWIIVFLFFSVSISFSDKSFLKNIFFHGIFRFFGVFSLSIYLNHQFLPLNINRLFPDESVNIRLWIYFTLILILSALNYILGKLLSKLLNNIPRLVVTSFLLCGVSFVVVLSGFLYRTILPRICFNGAGSEDSPYIISSETDIKNFRDLVNRGFSFEGNYFLQTENIDLQNENWIPIGQYTTGNYFKGIYNGGCHYIENLCIRIDDVKKSNNVGLFGCLAGTVKNLGIESGYIEGDCVGSITSHCIGDPMIINCYNKATVNGRARAGGICDNFVGGTVINCVNLGYVISPEPADVISYTAANVAAIYPDRLSTSFNGQYHYVGMSGVSVEEILDSGLIQLIEQGFINETDIEFWQSDTIQVAA